MSTKITSARRYSDYERIAGHFRRTPSTEFRVPMSAREAQSLRRGFYRFQKLVKTENSELAKELDDLIGPVGVRVEPPNIWDETPSVIIFYRSSIANALEKLEEHTDPNDPTAEDDADIFDLNGIEDLLSDRSN